MDIAVKHRRTIIDRKELVETLDAMAAEKLGNAATRIRLVQIFKAALAAGRAECRRRLEATEATGRETAAGLCFLVDQIIRTLHDFTVGHFYPIVNPTAGERLDLIALGGYGRGELAPGSDVDLLFLLPYKETPWHEQVIEFMLYLLWDLGLKVGHATRSVDECIRLAKQDQTIRTAMLEMRWLWGDQLLYAELKDRFTRDVMAGSGTDFLQAKLTERDDRHRRMGDSRYTVEPNLKEGKGGLRDLHTLWWIAKYIHKVDDAADLVGKGVLSADEYRRFVKAENFLWDVRCHLHFVTGRPEERLTFDVQPELARRLGYTDHAGTKGVERFMKHYFLVAKDVGSLTRIFCANLEEQARGRSSRLKLLRIPKRAKKLEGFLQEGNRLSVIEDTQFELAPIDMIRLFEVAQRQELDIHPHALHLITRNLKRIDATLRADPEANRLFLDILTSRKDPETALRRLNEAGVFGRFVPDFGRVVAQMQYDMYHVYTVDEHTIRAIGVLHQIESGQLAEEHPVADEIVAKILSRRVLYCAVLIHDIAKGRGRDHSVVGAEIAERLCPRFGLTEAETETVAWLVRYHLAMSNTAFKRDITDPKTVQDFAELVQSPERLRLLIVLTVADIRAVGPGIWNGWKGQLLRTLYHETEPLLSGGHVTAGRDRLARGHAEVSARLKDWRQDEIEAFFRRCPDSYFLSTDAPSIERHARLIREADRDNAPLTLATRIDRFRAVTEVTLYTADHAGLFARVTGAISVCGASIVDAKIFTTHDGMALDVFTIQDAEGDPFDRPERLAKLSTTIEQVLMGSVRPREILEGRAAPSKRTMNFTVVPRVLIDNNASTRMTVIEVNGRDRPGLLFELTRALFGLNLTIRSAHIATYGERAVDVFYVSDLFGHKVRHGGKLKAIERRLIDVLTPPPAGSVTVVGAGPAGADTAARPRRAATR
ncbi:[protein-PII] uridylyltransferase [Oleomonas cavernae]|uniref:Bifunctional uridylyltransferase/uridylyl-removing enzyme n=1 Tax=Oleomonas cavernae TaxID=2320859 RepID=A0A418WHM2_9PROT|nr:[protein-PII] uridylyltransferase [Oleomonas cavernae]RJF89537.1 [protein-PII] uridylyltransferase [Oleomonas cavernae]